MSDNPNKKVASAISLLLHSTDALTLNDKMIIQTIYELSKQTECVSPSEEFSEQGVVNEFIDRTFTLTFNEKDRISHKWLRENMSGPRTIKFNLLKKTLLKKGCCATRTGNTRYIAGLVIKND